MTLALTTDRTRPFQSCASPATTFSLGRLPPPGAGFARLRVVGPVVGVWNVAP
jgi:hypothetical protein